MRAATLLLCFAALISCAKYPVPGAIEAGLPARIPQQIVFEQEISGRILGLDLKAPSGVAIDDRNQLYVVDAGNHRLLKFDSRLQPIRDAGGYGSGIGRFVNPEDVVVDRALNLYVLDTGHRRILHFDANLNYVDEIIPEDDPREIISNLGKLSGVAITSIGEIIIADYDNSRLIRLDIFNRFSRYVGDFGYGRGALLNPEGLAVDGKGRCYVADGGNGRIASYDANGNFLGEIRPDSLVSPSAVAVSPDGVIWAADRGSSSIFALSAKGDVLMHQGGPGKGEYTFSDIAAIAVSRDGRLFLADRDNNRVLVYNIAYETSQ